MPILDVLGAKRHAVKLTDTDYARDADSDDTVGQQGNWKCERETEEPPPAFGGDNRTNQEEGAYAQKRAEQHIKAAS